MISRNLEQTLRRALSVAGERGHEYATLEHLLSSLIADRDAAAVMRACGVDLGMLGAEVDEFLDTGLPGLVTGRTGEAQPTAGFQRVVQRAAIHVQSSGRDEVTGANVLVALFSERESHAVYFLQLHDMTRLDAVNFITRGVAKASARPPASDGTGGMHGAPTPMGPTCGTGNPDGVTVGVFRVETLSREDRVDLYGILTARHVPGRTFAQTIAAVSGDISASADPGDANLASFLRVAERNGGFDFYPGLPAIEATVLAVAGAPGADAASAVASLRDPAETGGGPARAIAMVAFGALFAAGIPDAGTMLAGAIGDEATGGSLSPGAAAAASGAAACLGKWAENGFTDRAVLRPGFSAREIAAMAGARDAAGLQATLNRVAEMTVEREVARMGSTLDARLSQAG